MPALGKAFAHVHPGWLAACFAALALEYVIASAKLGWMAGDKSLWRQIKITCVKTLVNQALPGGIGGEAVRLYFLGSLLQSPGRAAGALISDRWSGLCGQSLWSGLSLLAYFLFREVTVALPGWGWISVVLISGGCLGWLRGPQILMAVSRVLAVGFQYLVPKKAYQALAGHAEPFAQEWMQWSRLSRRGLGLLGWTTLNQAVSIALIATASLALGREVDWLLVSPILLLGAVASVIPLTLGSLGVQEAFFAFGYQAAGLDAETGVGVSLLFRLVQIGPMALGLYAFLHGFRPAIEPDLGST